VITISIEVARLKSSSLVVLVRVVMLQDEVTVEHDNSYQNYEGTTLESCHFNGYSDHMLGQPIKGDRDMTQEI
jgi:hypothetical protein